MVSTEELVKEYDPLEEIMEINKQVQLLQVIYAGALADSVLQFSKEGILPQVTERKRQEQMATGKMRAAQFGITQPNEVFLKLSEIFACADWKIAESNGDGFAVQSASCKLCAIAKKMGAPSPCRLYCLDPMEGMVKGLKSDAVYTVEETLWDGAKCRVKVG
jgi:Pyruvate/2-oxoacid:ferredoxin oxidoreductase delta subunit